MKNVLTSGFLILCSAQQVFAETIEHGEHGNAGQHKSGGLPQLDPTTFPSQIFWLLVVFTFLFVFYSKKSLPAISKTIEKRQDRIQNDLESAEKLRTEVEVVHTNYENSLASARAEAAKCYTDVETYIQKKSQEKQEILRARSENDVQRLEDKISSSVKNVMNEMEKIAAQIAIDATEKIINVSVNPEEALNIVSSIGKTPAKKSSKAA